MKSFLKDLFSDNNNLNEKIVVGFASFLMMVIVLITDLVTAILEKNLPIHEFIFNGFLLITLGAFGIASIDKWINKNGDNKIDETKN